MLFPRIFYYQNLMVRTREEQNLMSICNPVNVFFEKREAKNARIYKKHRFYIYIYSKGLLTENTQLHVN